MGNYRGTRSRGQYREYGRCQINSSRTYSSARQSINQSTRSYLPTYTRGEPKFGNTSSQFGASLGDLLVELKSVIDFSIGVRNLKAINNVVNNVFYSLKPGQTAYLTISFGGGTASLISNTASPGFPSTSPSVINVSVTAPDVIIKPPLPDPLPPSTPSGKESGKSDSRNGRSDSRRGSEGYGADAREARSSSGVSRESHSPSGGETNPRGGGETNPGSGGDTHSPGGQNPGNGGSSGSSGSESPSSDISPGGLLG